ncbi:glycosyltransferase [Microbacterium hominis]|uniref:D-inositol 3-phosphate glycosyltransferase n=1 Tax=Microbacterium hominis TaxID=162426 RepID=A0A7D4U8T4_9MICO|nr:glycosyltransferase [Microbacterium hominis]QKJ20266.1 glycosyltransferase family 4 protein [Microbacterium hominis]
MTARPRVLWVTNVASPYRRPVWEALSERFDLTVALLETAAHTRADGRRGADWLDPGASAYRVEHLTTWRVSGGENARFAVLGWRGVRAPHPAAVLVGGWDQPGYWQLLVWAKLRRVRVVGFYESTLLTNRHRSGPIAAAKRWFFRRLDAIVVPGEAAREAAVAAGMDAARIRIGFNAVDVEAFHAAATAARADRSLSERSETKRAPRSADLVYVGQLIPRKNVDGLLRAFAALPGTPTLRIVGAGESQGALAALAEALGVAERVHMIPFVPNRDLAALLATARVLVLPSIEEVWGLVVNEALAAGLHVVVSDRAGVARSVRGMRGVTVVDPSRDELLRQGLERALADAASPIEHPEILAHTPAAFAGVFADALVPTASMTRR